MQNDLLTCIKEQIILSGPMNIAEYMQICLYHPTLGYYKHKNPFGREGDFITAPEISQIFGELLGAMYVDLWHKLNKPKKFHLIECGPGQGTLLLDCLRYAPADFCAALNLHLVEISPMLRNVQNSNLSAYAPACYECITQALESCKGAPVFILGNEFIDALPIHQFRYTNTGWQEKSITVTDGALQYKYQENVSSAFLNHHTTMAKVGDIFEHSPLAQQILAQIASFLETNMGCAVFIDYGSAKAGYGDTLQAVQSHQYQNPLLNPGSADLSAHVNFPELLASLKHFNLQTYGPIEQTQLLTSLGIEQRANYLLANTSHANRLNIERSVHRLISPLQMGSLFKAIALTHTQCPTPAGFTPCSMLVNSVA